MAPSLLAMTLSRFELLAVLSEARAVEREYVVAAAAGGSLNTPGVAAVQAVRATDGAGDGGVRALAYQPGLPAIATTHGAVLALTDHAVQVWAAVAQARPQDPPLAAETGPQLVHRATHALPGAPGEGGARALAPIDGGTVLLVATEAGVRLMVTTSPEAWSVSPPAAHTAHATAVRTRPRHRAC